MIFLFRGKRVEDGIWVYGDLVRWTKDTWSIFTSLSDDGPLEEHEVDKDTVGLYTGLRDRNDRWIFAGDIVKKRTYNGIKCLPVEFSFGTFHCGIGGGSSTATHPYTLADSRIEVVGNVYDNPELIDRSGL